MFRAVIFVNGRIPDIARARHLVQPGDMLIAADGGSRHVFEMGLLPSVVIGDLDSLHPGQAQRLRDEGVKNLPYPQDKDETDFELALKNARELGCMEILVIGALGDRLDQTLGNLCLLNDPALINCHIRLDDGLEEAFFCRDACQVDGRKGDIVSLVPWGGEVIGVHTDGLKWSLDGETLFPFKSRGISNTMTGDRVHIRVASGNLLIIHRRVS